jgi:hypothetical protein
MQYPELIQQYFERSTALQWYWSIYVLVIGGVLGFSTFRQQPNFIWTVLVTVLFGCFAYKNLGAIEGTASQQVAIWATLKDYPAPGANAADLRRVRDVLEPTLQPTEYGGFSGARNFHCMCDLLTILALWVKEWRRRNAEPGAQQTA